jgi:hypothetical protein
VQRRLDVDAQVRPVLGSEAVGGGPCGVLDWVDHRVVLLYYVASSWGFAAMKSRTAGGEGLTGDLLPAPVEGVDPEQGGEAGKVGGAGPGGGVGELLEERHTPDHPLHGFVRMSAGFGKQAHLSEGQGHSRPVTQLLFDGEGIEVPPLRLIQPPPLLGHHAQLVRGDREAPALLGEWGWC